MPDFDGGIDSEFKLVGSILPMQIVRYLLGCIAVLCT